MRYSVRWGGRTLPLFLTLAAGAHAATLPAGTVLTTQAELQFADTNGLRQVISEPLSVTVAKTSMAKVELDTRQATVRGTQAVGCTITNSGNYAGDLRVVVTTATNTEAMVVRDTNGDGVWQRSEITPILKLDALEPNRPVRCFVLVKAAPEVSTGEKGRAVVFVAPTDNLLQEVSTTLAVTFEEGGVKPAFTFQAGDGLNSSPIVRDGLALVGSEEGAVYAVKVSGADAGTLAWRYPTIGGVGGPIRGRVAVDETGYYFTANTGWAYHLDKNGDPVWKTQVVPSEVEMDAMPLVDGNVVTLACGDGRVRRLDKRTGELLDESPAIGGGALTTPAAPRAGELWVGGADGSLYTMNDTHGFTVLSAYNVSNQPMLATPYVDVVSGLVLSVTPQGNVYAMRMRSDQRVWGPVSLGTSVKGAPWVDSGSGVAYFAGTDGSVHALRVKDGAAIPGYPVHVADIGGFQNTPVVDPLRGGPSLLIVASDSGKLYALQANDPTRRVTFDTQDPGARFMGSPALSGATRDDMVVVSSSTGTLYGFYAADLVP